MSTQPSSITRTDLEKYPKTLEQDLLMLEKAGCDAVFCPDDLEMYERPSLIKIDFGSMDKVMEGKFRPGHFSGVAIVVSKLFNIIQPESAYFGQKDWQQFAIIRQLVDELKFNVTLHSVPIVRELDGLAMSSRNLRLNQIQRVHATVYFQALTWAKDELKRRHGFATRETKSEGNGGSNPGNATGVPGTGRQQEFGCFGELI